MDEREPKIKITFSKKPLSNWFSLMDAAFDNRLTLSSDEICKYKNARALLRAVYNQKEQEKPRD